MSGHIRYHGNNCFDSVHDSSHGTCHLSPESYEDSHTVVASSVMAPWSQYNTRLELYHTSPYAFSNRSPNPHAFDNENPTAHYLNAIGDSLSPVEPFHRRTSSDAATYFSHSPSTSSSLPCDYVAATGSTASTTLPVEKYADVSIIICGQCDQVFTGIYRAGNRARHVRQKHLGVVSSLYECTVPNCSKFYQRKDARLKHMRKRHPELHVAPVQRRRHEVPSTPVCNRIHVASAPTQLFHTTEHDAFVTPGTRGHFGVVMPSTGTLLSTPSYSAESLQHSAPTLTNPSSTYSLFDLNFLGPYSPHYRRPASLPPNVIEDCSLLRRAFPSRRSLQRDHDGCIDPAILDSPDDASKDDTVYCGYAGR